MGLSREVEAKQPGLRVQGQFTERGMKFQITSRVKKPLSSRSTCREQRDMEMGGGNRQL